jgi:hypothetical protein
LLARQDFFALEVAAIGDNIERVGLKNGLGLPGYVCKLRPYRKLDSDIPMVKSTEHWLSFDTPVALNGPAIGRILPQ